MDQSRRLSSLSLSHSTSLAASRLSRLVPPTLFFLLFSRQRPINHGLRLQGELATDEANARDASTPDATEADSPYTDSAHFTQRGELHFRRLMGGHPLLLIGARVERDTER